MAATSEGRLRPRRRHVASIAAPSARTAAPSARRAGFAQVAVSAEASANATPLSSKPRAVLAFIDTQPGPRLTRAGTPRSQPASTTRPTTATTAPSAFPIRIGDGPRYDNRDGPSRTAFVAIGTGRRRTDAAQRRTTRIGRPRAGNQHRPGLAHTIKGSVCSIAALASEIRRSPVEWCGLGAAAPAVQASAGAPAARLGVMFAFNRNRLPGSYRSLRATSRWYFPAP